MRRAKY